MARRRTRRRSRRGGRVGIKSAKAMTMGATKAAKQGEAMAHSATKMCANIPNMFLKKDCEKRVKKSADAAKAKMEAAKKKINVAEKKLSKVKQMAKSIDNAELDRAKKAVRTASQPGSHVRRHSIGGRKRRRTKRRRRSRSRSRGRKSRRRKRRRSRRRRR